MFSLLTNSRSCFTSSSKFSLASDALGTISNNVETERISRTVILIDIILPSMAYAYIVISLTNFKLISYFRRMSNVSYVIVFGFYCKEWLLQCPRLLMTILHRLLIARTFMGFALANKGETPPPPRSTCIFIMTDFIWYYSA